MVSTSRNKVIFEEMDFHWQKKRPNKRMLFQVGRKSVPLAEMKNLFKNTFLLDEKTIYIGKNI